MSSSGLAQQREARTLREVVVRSPEAVNEVWCRKVFRQLLQALERRHALGQPHATITPDTIGFDRNGEPVLLDSADPAGAPGEADDVQALGAVVHYAITGELPACAPLKGRGLDGYSESLIGAVDKCIAPEPRERPQTIDELRNLLGIVSLGPPGTLAPAAQAGAHFEPVAHRARTGSLLDRWQRWMLISAAVLTLLAAGVAWFALLRGADARDNFVLTLPQAIPPAKTLDPNETLVQEPAGAAPSVPAPAAMPSPAAPPSPGAGRTATPAAPAPKPAHAAPVPARQAASTNYRLLIKPWGTVYVNGVERGVSPPLKQLTLPPGRHTVRIVNPHFPDRVIKVEAGKGQGGRIVHDFASP